MSVIGRFKAIPGNAKTTFNEIVHESAFDALEGSFKRFGRANRAMVKGIGSGIRGRK